MNAEENQGTETQEIRLDFAKKEDFKEDKVKKAGLISFLIGGNQNQNEDFHQFTDEKEKDHQENDQSEEEEDISPIKTEGSIDEEDNFEKQSQLKMRQKVIINEIENAMAKLKDLGQKDQSQPEISNQVNEIYKKIESLEQESKKNKGILAVLKKKILENPDNSGGISPENQKYGALLRKIRTGKRKLLINKFELKILHLSKQITNKRLEDIEEEIEKDNRTLLDCDAYLLLSVVLEYLVFFILFGLLFLLLMILLVSFAFVFMTVHCFLVIFRCSSCEKLAKTIKEVVKYFLIMVYLILHLVFLLSFFWILCFPGVLVVATQFICVSELEKLDYGEVEDTMWLLLLKVLMILFFFFLSMKEVSGAFDVISYFYKKSFEKNSLDRYLFLLRICPQLLQTFMCFWICYINIYLIKEVDDVPNLIQNFAALVIVLEFDNYVMDFLRYMRFYTIYKKLIVFFGDKKEENKAKIEKEEKSKKIEEAKKLIPEYENMIKNLKKNKENETDFDPENKIKEAKRQYESMKKKAPGLTISQLESNNSNNVSENEQKFAEFLQILKSFLDNNICKKAISYLGQQREIKIMLKEKELPIEKKYEMEKIEKAVFNWLTFIVVVLGILAVLFIFMETYEN